MTNVEWIDREAFYQLGFEWIETTHHPDASGSGGTITSTRTRQMSTHGWVKISYPSDHQDAHNPVAFHDAIRDHVRERSAKNGHPIPTNAIVTFAHVEPLAGYLDRFQTGTRPITEEN